MAPSWRLRGGFYGQVSTKMQFMIYVMVRVVLYNPLAAADQFRLKEISTAMEGTGFVFLICDYFPPRSGPAEEYKQTDHRLD